MSSRRQGTRGSGRRRGAPERPRKAALCAPRMTEGGRGSACPARGPGLARRAWDPGAGVASLPDRTCTYLAAREWSFAFQSILARERLQLSSSLWRMVVSWGAMPSRSLPRLRCRSACGWAARALAVVQMHASDGGDLKGLACFGTFSGGGGGGDGDGCRAQALGLWRFNSWRSL